MCIEGYPERNTPTVLVYKDGDIRRQLVTLKEMRGESTSVDDFEKLLIKLEAVKQNDPRLKRRPANQDAQTSNRTIRQGRNAAFDANDENSDLDI